MRGFSILSLSVILLSFTLPLGAEGELTLGECKEQFDQCVESCEEWCREEAEANCAACGNRPGCELDRFCCGQPQCSVVYSPKWCAAPGYTACAGAAFTRYRDCMGSCNERFRAASTDEERSTVRAECPVRCEEIFDEMLIVCKDLTCAATCREEGSPGGRWVSFDSDRGWDACSCEGSAAVEEAETPQPPAPVVVEPEPPAPKTIEPPVGKPLGPPLPKPAALPVVERPVEKPPLPRDPAGYYCKLSDVRKECYLRKNRTDSCVDVEFELCAYIRPRFDYQENLVIRGFAGRMYGPRISLFDVIAAPLLPDGSLGEDLICRSKEDFQCRELTGADGGPADLFEDYDSWVILPDGYVAVGCGMRIHQRKLKTLVLYGRELAAGHLFGETLPFSGGSEPGAVPECAVIDDDSVLVGLAAATRQSDLQRFCLSFAEIAATPLLGVEPE